MTKVKYKLKEIYPRVFLVTIKDRYDLAMTFCRAQEFYESPLKEIRGKSFSMVEFQRLYSKKFGDGAFSYSLDWAGFNLTKNVIDKFMSTAVPDYNFYDDVFSDIYLRITKGSGRESPQYCLIACEPVSKSKEHQITINHEVAHSFYYLDKDYRKEVNSILKRLDKNIISRTRNNLLGLGYGKSTIKDEIHAYIATQPLDFPISVKHSEKSKFAPIQEELQSLFLKTCKKNKNRKY